MTDSFRFDNTYAQALSGFSTPCTASIAPAPEVVLFNHELAAELGLTIGPERAAQIFSGNAVPQGAEPIATAYAGHQFGGFSSQLGDGRALLLGEHICPDGRRVDVQLKGSGPTPFSRRGDGKATLGPMLREYFLGEAMHALRIPTSRALAVVTTGEPVLRERSLPGAVLTRIASSHLRVGTFEYFSHRGDLHRLRQLTDYAVARHAPEHTDDPVRGLLLHVQDALASTVAKWMQVGFIHGVMNTDNLTISGETLDYGPCAFMDRTDPATVFSSIDHQGRYAYGNQPHMAQWGFARLAESLLPILDPDPNTALRTAEQIVGDFKQVYEAHWLAGMREKLGLYTAQPKDDELIALLLSELHREALDFTTFFRRLGQEPCALPAWEEQWKMRLHAEPQAPDRSARMASTNPVYIPRNHLVEEALSAAIQGDLGPSHLLLRALKNPFVEQPELQRYAEPAPMSSPPYRTFCGT